MRMLNTIRAAAGAALIAAASLAAPQAEAKWVFAQNHPDLEWFTIETEHFYVHYPVSKRTKEQGNKHFIDATWAARKMATVADEMWKPMCDEFDYYLTEKVHIVLLEQPDDLEGFTVPAWDWVEISANPGASFYRMRGRMEWFADVLVHEFAHVVSLKQNAPFTEHSFGVALRGLFRDGINNQQQGASIFISDTDPTFWTEGGAEYWSDNSGYNWWTPSRDQNIRTTFLDNRVLDCHAWRSHGMGGDWGDGERRYQQGYSFALYLRERFGEMTYNEFAEVSSKRWRADWTTIIEDVTGEDVCSLHAGWVDYLSTKYGKVREDVRNQGEALGYELLTDPNPWNFTTPEGRDEWLDGQETDRGRWEKERELAKVTGTWDGYARYNADGSWLGEHARGVTHFAPDAESAYPHSTQGYTGGLSSHADVLAESGDRAAHIPTDFLHAWDFVPGSNKVVVTANEDSYRTNFQKTFRLEQGYNWNQLWLVDLDKTWTGKRKHRDGKESYQSFGKPKGPGKGKYRNDAFTRIPNTKRGSAPAVSPDGTRIAYLEYGDGTHNLVVIDLDGSNKKYLTEYRDGTWMQVIDWSPDGKQVVVPMFRNYEQDLYAFDVDTGDVRALTRDRWEVQDPHWTPEGIYFSAEPTGIFNIYRLDPDTGDVVQITNVDSSAQMPSLTPEGNLLFTNFTGHGWRNWGLGRDEFLEKPVDYFGTRDIDTAAVNAELAYSEDLSYWQETTTKYRNGPKNWIPLQFIPVFGIDNDSRTDFGLNAGMQVLAFDFVEKNDVFLYAQVGQDSFVQGAWTFQQWAPSITLGGFHGSFKSDFGLLLDEDDNLATRDDQTKWDQKQHQYSSFVFGSVDYAWNNSLNASLYGQGFQFGFKGSDDKTFLPYMRGYTGGLNLQWLNYYGSGAIFDLSHNYTDIKYVPQGGHDTDDGQILDDYHYNKAEVILSGRVGAPTFGLKPLSFVRDHGHRIFLNGQLGYIDRNVQFQDEFRAGGVHPMYQNFRDNRPNNTFSGYPGWSLSGETMIIGTAAYEFPLVRYIRKSMGPIYVQDMWMSVGGTAGNLWSHVIKEEAREDGRTYFDGFGQEVAYNPNDVRREIPFLDPAYKNGNRVLTDASVELRVRSALNDVNNFDSFFRVSYGFNAISGINDVNGDDISDTTDPGTGNSLSQEREQAGPRFYLGLGTGW